MAYDDLDQIIVSVALVKPRDGVFVKEIRYALVIATTVEVLMLALRFEDDNVYKEVSLFPSMYFVVDPRWFQSLGYLQKRFTSHFPSCYGQHAHVEDAGHG